MICPHIVHNLTSPRWNPTPSTVTHCSRNELSQGTLSKVSPNWTKQQLISPNHTHENYFGTVSDMSTQHSRTNQSEVDHPPIHSDTLLMLLPVAGTNKIQNHIGTCKVNTQYSWSCDLIPRPFLPPAVPTTNQNGKMECVILCTNNS